MEQMRGLILVLSLSVFLSACQSVKVTTLNEPLSATVESRPLDISRYRPQSINTKCLPPRINSSAQPDILSLLVLASDGRAAWSDTVAGLAQRTACEQRLRRELISKFDGASDAIPVDVSLLSTYSPPSETSLGYSVKGLLSLFTFGLVPVKISADHEFGLLMRDLDGQSLHASVVKVSTTVHRSINPVTPLLMSRNPDARVDWSPGSTLSGFFWPRATDLARSQHPFTVQRALSAYGTSGVSALTGESMESK